MKTENTAIIGLVVGVAIGALFVDGLFAQGKAPGAYAVVSFTDFGDPAAFKTNVGEPSPAAIKKHGGRFIARTDTVVPLRAADPPLTRYVVIAFDDVPQAKAWWDSDDWKPIKTYLEKHTKGSAFAVEAIPQ
jgi:uncharacterized protein (DUF1330 family)